MKHIVFLFLAFLLRSTLAVSIQQQKSEIAENCIISLTTQTNPPLISTPTLDLIHPDPTAQNQITLPPSTPILISCAQSTFTADPFRNANAIPATCLSGDLFATAANYTFAFRALDCVAPAASAARYTARTCPAGRLLEIGFALAPAAFAPTIALCFDQAGRNARWSRFTLTKRIAAHVSGVPRPPFTEAIFYNLTAKVDRLYMRATQRATLNGLLGLEPNSTRYVQDNDWYLARGHLTAKADFVLAAEQLATFYFVNAAPQWQVFNGNNWEAIEDSVRRLADERTVDLRVWTGTFGVATLPHAGTGEQVELWLFEDENGRAIAVPLVYWKVVYEPIGRLGVALLGVNNPYLDDVATLCRDVSEVIEWAVWEKQNVTRGFCYACAIDEFRQVVDYLPEFEVSGLLV